MMVQFTYSLICDLIYHILAHMKVDNASNLYSENYIHRISQAKNENCTDLSQKVLHMLDYYNKNFERLGIINFLPCYCPSIQDLLKATSTYVGFTDEDKEMFVFPLNKLVESEYSFYETYWSALHRETKKEREKLEQWIKNEFSKYEVLFSYFKKSAVIGFSYSLTCNGRGYYQEDTFNAIVPFETEECKYETVFYQIMHEFTHQFTDGIIGTNIKMDDGTHDVSENAAILFDYYLIKNIYPQKTSSYFKWISKFAKIDCCDEKTFISYFAVENNLNDKLINLVNEIIGFDSLDI